MKPRNAPPLLTVSSVHFTAPFRWETDSLPLLRNLTSAVGREDSVHIYGEELRDTVLRSLEHNHVLMLLVTAAYTPGEEAKGFGEVKSQVQSHGTVLDWHQPLHPQVHMG